MSPCDTIAVVGGFILIMLFQRRVESQFARLLVNLSQHEIDMIISILLQRLYLGRFKFIEELERLERFRCYKVCTYDVMLFSVIDLPDRTLWVFDVHPYSNHRRLTGFGMNIHTDMQNL